MGKFALAFVFFLLSAIASAQDVANISRSQFFASSTNGPCWDLGGNSGVVYHVVRWRTPTTVSGGTIKLEGSNASDCSSPVDIVAATSATASSSSQVVYSARRYVRLVTASYAGSGNIEASYFGYLFDPSALTVYNSTQPTLTNGQQSDLQITTRAELKTAVMDAAGNARGANVNASNQLSTSVDNSVTIGTFPDNEPINVGQVGGAAVQVATNGMNTTGAGLQAKANSFQCDDTTPAAITENQFGNARMNCTTHAQLTQLIDTAGVAVPTATTGNGATDGQTQRVTISNDSTGVLRTSGQNAKQPIFCDQTAFLNMTTATTTQAVALSGATVVYICSYALHVGGAADVKLVRGTGTNCATGQADITTTYDFAAADVGINRTAGAGNVVAKGNAGDAVCATSSAATDVDIEISYVQF